MVEEVASVTESTVESLLQASLLVENVVKVAILLRNASAAMKIVLLTRVISIAAHAKPNASLLVLLMAMAATQQAVIVDVSKAAHMKLNVLVPVSLVE